jgi:Tol biopolymer transport system component
MRIRTTTLCCLVLALAAAGCGDPSADRGIALFRGGTAAATQAGLAAADTVVAVARRVPVDPLSLGIDYTASVSANGSRVAITDWTTGDIVLRSLPAGEETRVTRNPTSFQPGLAMHNRLSPAGDRVATSWYECDASAYPPCRTQLRVLRVDGGGEPTVAYAPEDGAQPLLAEWSPDGRLLLAVVWGPDHRKELIVVPADGGEPRALRSLGWSAPRMAAFSPDGRHVAYDLKTREESDARDIHVVAVDGTGARPLVEHDSDDWLLGWSPDGHVVFSSNRSGTPSAWRLRVEDGRPVGAPELVKPDIWRVSPLGFQENGSLYYLSYTRSPDVHMATLDTQSGRVVGPPTLAVAQAIGGTQQPVWSPDGRHMAYRAQKSPSGLSAMAQYGLMVRSMETGETRELRVPAGIGGLSSPHWTPDGRALLARAQFDRGQTNLLRIDVQTGQVERIWESADLWPSFHVLPDGEHIVLTEDMPASEAAPRGGERIVVRNLATGSTRVIASHVRDGPQRSVFWHMALARDGRALAFVEARDQTAARLAVIPLTGGEPRVLLTEAQSGPMPAWMNVASLAWTPDGSAILFTRTDEDMTGVGRSLWRISAAGGEPVRIGDFPDGIAAVQVHPDGRRIAFVSGRPEAELWVLESLEPVQPRPATGAAR